MDGPKEGTFELSWAATTEALLIVTAAVFVGIFGGAVQCIEYAACHEARLCSNASWWRPMELSCSFYNRVTLSGDKLYGSANASDLGSLTRGVCSPGERMHVNYVTGRTECAPWRAWPSALNTEIMKPGAAAMHDKVCGAWIDAGPTAPTAVSYWSFYDGKNADAAIRASEKGAYSSSRLSATDMGKFYAACQQTVLAGSTAIRASGKGAYEHLKTGLTGLTTERRVLEAAGWLSSFHCDGVVQVGVTVSGAQYKATMSHGSAFSSGVLAEALYALDEPRSFQDMAERGRSLIAANAESSPRVNITQLEFIFEGSTLRTDHDTVPLLYGVTPSLDGLTWLATQAYFEEASAFLHGTAALCAFALEGSLDVTVAGGWTAHAAAELKRIQAERPAAAALGRLRRGHDPERLAKEPTGETVAQASTVTFSQLRAEPAGDASEDCAAMTRFLFPDRIDQEHFSLMITDNLYDRMHTITDALREQVAEAVVNHPNISNILNNPSEVAAAVRSTVVRIAGAPRSSWAGIARDFADGALQSTDGPLLMALRQSRAIFMDRVNILFDNLNLCTGPPLYDALEQNAYIYPGADCTHVMLGVLRKPFADERYDDTSLATRAGYIMVHELSHNTLVTTWNATAQNELLHRYSSNLHSEALADVTAAVAIVNSGYATGREVCEHISQLWCARTPLMYSHSAAAVHPGPNERGDLLCGTLQDLGLM